MSTKISKTIDDLGIQSYIDYEQNRKYFDEEFTSYSKSIASQLATDVFQPIMVTDYQLLFELDTRGATWSLMPPPKNYNDQRGRIFTYQLGPKLGPSELIELQLGKIEEKRITEKKKHDQEKEKKKKPNWETEEELKLVEKEAKALIDMMQNIQVLNKIMADITAERYRYSKG